jgi:hypothetical protein
VAEAPGHDVEAAAWFSHLESQKGDFFGSEVIELPVGHALHVPAEEFGDMYLVRHPTGEALMVVIIQSPDERDSTLAPLVIGTLRFESF